MTNRDLSVDGLSPSHMRILEDVASALRNGFGGAPAPDSDLVCRVFYEDFGNRLILHHALNDSPMSKKPFEFAFARSIRAAGRQAKLTRSRTNPGQDVTVDGVPYSCKTEAAQGIKPALITVSKLMEARWIRECSTGEDFAAAVRDKVVHHLNQYERIVVLRVFQQEDENTVKYDLVEVPKTVLLAVETLAPNAFSQRTKSGGSRAHIYVDGERAFTLGLDGSVEKVTISSLRTDLCPHHATWVVPSTFLEVKDTPANSS